MNARGVDERREGDGDGDGVRNVRGGDVRRGDGVRRGHGARRGDGLRGLVGAWHRARTSTRDLIIAAMWLAVGLVCLLAGWYPLWPVAAVLPGGVVVFAATLVALVAIDLLRSRRPLLALGLGVVVTAVDLLHGGSLGATLVFTDLIYAAVKSSSDRAVARLARLAGGIAVVTGVGLVLTMPHEPATIVVVVQWALIIGVSVLWGWNVRSERERTRSALDAEHERQTRRLQHDLAHDLHDLVANQIAVAGLHIEAAKLLAERRAEAGTVPGAPPPLDLDLDRKLGASLDSAKLGTDQAHRELRNLIAVLTAVDELADHGPVRLPDELDDLSHLLPEGRDLVWRGHGMRVLADRLQRGGERRGRVIMRVLHELVVNAGKHGAGDVHVDVDVRADVRPDVQPDVRPDVQSGSGDPLDDGAGSSERLVITVTNGLASGSPRTAAPGNGIGLTGVQLLLRGVGGELVAERRAAQWHAEVRFSGDSAHGGSAHEGSAHEGSAR